MKECTAYITHCYFEDVKHMIQFIPRKKDDPERIKDKQIIDQWGTLEISNFILVHFKQKMDSVRLKRGVQSKKFWQAKGFYNSSWIFFFLQKMVRKWALQFEKVFNFIEKCMQCDLGRYISNLKRIDQFQITQITLNICHCKI